MAVSQQLQQEAERAADRRRRRQAGVLGRAREPRGRAAVAVEQVEPERLDRPQHPARPLDQVAAQRAGEPQARPDRRQRRQHALHERGRQREHPPHRRVPARSGGTERRDRRRHVAVQRERAAVLERVREHRRRVDPLQPVALQPQLAHRGRRRRHRHERRAAVVHEARQRRLRRRRGSARMRRVVEHDRVEAVRREVDRRDQPVVPGADDHDSRHESAIPNRGARYPPKADDRTGLGPAAPGRAWST